MRPRFLLTRNIGGLPLYLPMLPEITYEVRTRERAFLVCAITGEPPEERVRILAGFDDEPSATVCLHQVMRLVVKPWKEIVDVPFIVHGAAELGDRSSVHERLQLVVESERETKGELLAFSPDTLRNAEVEGADPETLGRLLADLMKLRSQKILLLGLLCAEGRSIDSETQSRMLPAELDLFTKVKMGVIDYIQTFGDLLPPSSGSQETPEPEPRPDTIYDDCIRRIAKRRS